MVLSSDLIKQFAKSTKDETKKTTEATVYGTVIQQSSGTHVRLDGTELLTPVETTAEINNGERVAVLLKNHTAMVMGNVSNPSASTRTVSGIRADVDNNGNKIEAMNNTVTAIDNQVTAQGNNIALINNTIVSQGNTITAQGNKIEVINSTINAHGSQISTMNDTIISQGNSIELLDNTITAQGNDIKIYNSSFQITDGVVTGIKGIDTDWITVGSLEAGFADIENLKANKLSVTDANIKYANIEFTNIGKAAMENFYAKSGLIKNVVVGDQTITGELVGVTIRGDLIEGNTIVADKLVVKGANGLYYKLNTDGVTTEAEQTDYNSLSGTIIRAKSVAAEKIAVEDLVAFGATIGGFNITENSIYSGVKETVDNGTRGIYLDNTGQIGFGDSINYLKFYKDQNGNYKLAISAESMVLSSSSVNVADAINSAQSKADAAVIKTIEEFYLSSSPTTLSDGSWSPAQPVWRDGMYIWRRNKVTYGSGLIEYTPSETGVCITGNTGAKGIQGLQGEKGDRGIQGPKGDTGPQGNTSYFHIKYSDVENPTSSSDMKETPSTYIGTYVDYTSTDSTDPSAYTWARFQGIQGPKGDQGIPGIGIDGKTSYLHIAYANSEDGSSGFSVSDSVGKLYIGQYTDFTSTDSTDYKKYSWTKIKGEDGVSISSVDVLYYKSTSSTSLTGGSWVTTNPGWENGKYIWSKTAVVYSDGDTTETTPVCITGAKGSTGGTGAAGADGNGVVSIVEQYYQSTSAKSLSGGSWSTTYPGWSDGKYIWTRSIITYTSGDPTTTTPVCVTGSKGATGATGKGIRSVAEKYAVSSSNSTAPTTWYDTVQTMTTTKKYLWNYEIITYTDNSTSETSKRVIGTYGDTGATGGTGATGKGVKTITNYYLATASSSGITTSTSGWTTSVQNVSSSKKYLWNYEVLTYTDNSTTTTSPCIIGAYGDKGDTGSAGNGVASTEVTYQAGSSGTTAPTGTWYSSPPQTSASAPYMWTRTRLTYTNGSSSVSYSVGSTPEGIEIGGRNLSRYGELITYSGSSISYDRGTNKYTITSPVSSDTDWGTGIKFNNKAKIPYGKTYRVSVEVYLPADGHIVVDFNNSLASGSIAGGNDNDNGSARTNSRFNVKANTWTKLVWGSANTHSNNTNKVDILIWDGIGLITANNSGNTIWYLKNPKIELGNKATDWTPAPEDVDSSISTAQSTADTAKTNAANAQSTANAAKAWTDANGSNMTSLLSMVKKWTNNAVSDTTTIQGGWIATNTITANKLAIGNFNNLCEINPDNYNPNSVTVTTINNLKYFSVGSTSTADYWTLRFRKFPASSVFRVGDKYLLRANGYANGGSWVFYARVWYTDGTCKNLGSVIATVPTSMGTISATLPISYGHTTAGKTISDLEMSIQVANTANVLYIRDIVIYQMGTGELIVDGAITSDKIASSAITADKIASSAITAAKIAAKAVTADKLSVTSLSAISANLGSITAGSINIGSGKFVVTSAGALTATGATITGNITATSGSFTGTVNANEGTIGNIKISGNKISYDSIDSSYGTLAKFEISKSQLSYGCMIVKGNSMQIGRDQRGQTFIDGNDTTRIYGDFLFQDYSNTMRRPVASVSGDGSRVGYMGSSVSNGVKIAAQWNVAGASLSIKTFTASSSDIRLKENIRPTEVNALSVINQMGLYQFDWKRDGYHQKIGFVADYLEQQDEHLAIGGGYDEDGNMDEKVVNDFYLMGYAIKGIQELDAKSTKVYSATKSLEARINSLQYQLQQAFDKIAKQEKQINLLTQ